ncbi:hypothetical protein WN944_019101 [Citrus x changshan-huyou]|uniref:Tobamovirus multiplication protein 2A n=1 Tax=Citrus x changshan-huyou TaxID=2935761 RepID=A0AAP0LUL8_9ROSI
MVGYGIYLFVEYKRVDNLGTVSPVSGDEGFVQLGRPMLMAVSLADSIFDKLPKACVIEYSFTDCDKQCPAFEISSSSHFSVHLLHAFFYFDKSWREEIPADRTGDFNMIYDFLKENWNIVKWVALGVVILQALIFLLAIIVRAANRPVEYDSDDELIAPRQQIRQPLINRPTPPATGVPVAGSLDQRPSRNDAWSTRMREKYGLDTSEFTYNPSESHRFQQVATQPAEERSRCTIM